jgi:hypothetical protein
MSIPADIEVADIDNARIAINAPLNPGRAPAAESRPVVLSVEDLAAINALTTAITSVGGFVDGLEGLATSLNGYVDGLETLVGTSNTNLAQIHTDLATTLAAYVDGLETLVTSSNTKLDSLHTDLATTLAGYVDGLETLVGTTNTGNAAILAQETAINTVLGTTAGAAVITSVAGTIQGYLRGIVALLVSGITVASHAVTNAGTFAVQATLAAAPAAIAKAEDVASADADVGVPAMAVRKATPANTSGTDGDYEMLQMSAGRLWVSAIVEAGSALIGRAVADASAATGGIASTARLLSAVGTSGDAANVKASAGRLYAVQGYNASTSVRYLKLYNSVSAPTAGSGTPVKTLALPPSCGFAFDWPHGYSFATGIGFTLVTGSADNSSTGVTAGDILGLNLDYV